MRNNFYSENRQIQPEKTHQARLPTVQSVSRSKSQKDEGDSMSKLANKVALVTGGSRGIGAAIAKRLASDGASVAITYAKDSKAAAEVVKAIEQKGGKAIAIQADAADREAVKGA